MGRDSQPVHSEPPIQGESTRALLRVFGQRYLPAADCSQTYVLRHARQFVRKTE